MPKKSIKQVKDSGTTRRQQVDEKKKSLSTIKNVHNKIHIDVKNSKRWLSLKKKLKYLTDDDFVVHLLDLAEANLRQDELSSSKISKEDNEDKNQVEKVEKNQLELDGPRRRSPRKQVVSISPETLKETIDESQKLLEENQTDHVKQKSKIKHHKNRTKHHKEKRKKHRSSKNPDSETSSTLEDKKSDKLSKEIIENVDKTVDLLKMINEKKTEETILDSVVEKNKIQDSNVALTSSMNSKENICQNLPINDEQIDKNLIMQDDSTSLKNISPSITVLKHGTDILNIASTSPGKLNPKFNIKDLGNSEEISSDDNRSLSEIPVNYPESDDKKRTKKRKNMANKTKMSVDKNVEENDDESNHKHKKKKHKHNDNKNKKIHDVRKAPQDGLIPLEQREAISNGFPPDLPDHPVLPLSNTEFDGSLPDHQRLAIKIKLCQDCNSRHVQDACPLLSANYEIFDAITYEDWLKKHKNNQELTKALATNNPMSEGYEKYQDDGFESEEDDTNQYKTTKLKSPNEDKKLQIDYDKPLFSRESLPNCFELKLTNSDHGIGIYAKNTVPIYSKLGPLIGSVVKEMDIPDDFSMRHIWEIDNNGKTIYLSTTDPIKSNWLRYMRPAETKDERNVAVIINNDKLYFITSQNINTGCELLYWVDSQLSVWTRKNKTDKTNCGGCNINFLHPFYYRLHCCIFHDTNYSLTIRKYHCKICGVAVLGKDNIMKHAAELHAGRGAYQCQYCKKFFLRLNYLEMHRTYGCSKNPQRSRPLCDFCGRKFCQPQKLKVHIKRMHSDMSEVLKEFQCKSCLKLLGSRAALQRHMKEVHHKDVVAAATCDRCGKMFQNKSNLKIHMLTHSGVKPFKCQEQNCKAAFTTKQCLQFHYKKVHGLSEDMMPKIERSVAYTFESYSGGQHDENENDNENENENENENDHDNDNDNDSDNTSNLQQSNSQDNSRNSLDDFSSENGGGSSGGVVTIQPNEINDYDDCDTSVIQEPSRDEEEIINQQLQIDTNQQHEHQHQQQLQLQEQQQEIYTSTRLQSKGSKKWMGEFNPPSIKLNEQTHQITLSQTSDIYEFDDTTNKKDTIPITNINDKLTMNIYHRNESTNASLLVEAALDAAERDIGGVSSPILDDNDRDSNIYTITNQLNSPLPSRSPTEDNHIDFHIQQQDDLMSPVQTPDNRNTSPLNIHNDYHLHRNVDYITTTPTPITRTQNIDQYLHHDDIPRTLSSSSSPPLPLPPPPSSSSLSTNYIHMTHVDLESPSTTPNSRYHQDIHHHHHNHHHHQQQQHQLQNDNLTDEENESVAQNLSISVKEKTLQLDLPTPYKYDQLDLEFRERNFEPFILTNELQGLDMSARSFHSFNGQSPRYQQQQQQQQQQSSLPPLPPPPPPLPSSSSSSLSTHHHYDNINERQSVDLSRSNNNYTPPPYTHSGDVLRVVSLDLTPGGRHSVDLSPIRTHIHNNTSRIITSPQSPVSTNHIIDENIDNRLLSPLPLPPLAPLPSYSSAYPVSPAAYHPPRPGYHYSGYY